MPPATYLFRSSHGIYYFRVITPKYVQLRIPKTPRETRESLRTSNYKQAEKLARLHWEQITSVMNTIEEQITKFEQLLHDDLENELDATQRDKVQSIINQLKTKYDWLIKRGQSGKIIDLDDIESLYNQLRPIYQQAYLTNSIYIYDGI